MIDTASTDLWLPLPNSSGCAPNPCPPGTWNPDDSITSVSTGLPYNVSFGLTPDLTVNGEYYNDIVRLGGVILENQTLATADVPKPLFDGNLWGILGLGSRYGEGLFGSPASPVAGQPDATYTPVWENLVHWGYIERRLFSIWLNDQAAKTGTILFGGFDEEKYEGELRSVPLILGTVGGEKVFTEWRVNLTSVSRADENGNVELLTASNFTIQVILDTGSPNMYLPTDLYAAITAPLNPAIISTFPYVACTFRDSTTALEFSFPGRNRSEGPKIRVPYREIIYPFGYPANMGEIRDSEGNELCYFGLQPTDGAIRLIGATLIRSAYMVYDAENLEIRMAQVKHNSPYRWL